MTRQSCRTLWFIVKCSLLLFPAIYATAFTPLQTKVFQRQRRQLCIHRLSSGSAFVSTVDPNTVKFEHDTLDQEKAQPKVGVLLLNLGGPEKESDVEGKSESV